MPISLEKFVQQLEESGVLAGNTLVDFLPPKAAPQSAEDLGRELIRQKKLTKFQVEEVYRGKGKSLTLGNYVLLEKIGAGGMGQVFKARHRRMDRFVAVKLLPPAMTKDKAAIARFEREVKAAAKLRHPNIVAADDADCANGVHFLVMELVDGSDLSELVTKNGPLPVEMAVNYIQQAARGLEAAHNEGIVHRDIKPANLLVDKKGTVKILDMGLARLNGEADAAAQADLTGTGMVMGTIDYMAPEQAISTRNADSRADIYALGCSLYYLLTGQATYGGETLMAKLLAHRESLIPSLRATRPDIPEQVDAAFQKMVAKRVQDRYQTMTEVIAVLEHCGPGKALPSRTQHAQASSVQMQQTQAVYADSGMTDFLKGFPSLQVEPTPTIAAKARAQPAAGDGNRRKWLIGGGVLGALSLLIAVVVMVNRPSSKLPAPKGERNVKVARKAKPRTPAAEPAAEPQPGPGLLALETPGFDQWVKDVAALPAEQQVAAVSKKLVELNPESDGTISNPWNASLPPTPVDGKIVELTIYTDKVTDLSPLRAFPELSQLSCSAKKNPARQLDLSPLRGTKVTSLSCSQELVDYSTLRGLKLTTFACYGPGNTDLTPLSGLPLNTLAVSGNWFVENLGPLKGMPLTVFSCDNCLVADLSPLRGMPITTLAFRVTQVADLSPLKGMPLEMLSCEMTLITDLSPLAGMKLKKLSFTPKPELRGLQAIRQMGSLMEIGVSWDKMMPSGEFWRKFDAGEFKSP